MKSLVLGLALGAACLSVARAETPAPAAPVATPVSAPAPASAATAPDPAAPAAPRPCCTIPAGTVIDIEILDNLTTKVVKKGDRFAIRLAAPIIADGRVIVPAGAKGEGEVIDAAKGGLMGKAGELLLAARYLEIDGERVPLRAFRLGRRGTDNSDVSLAIAMVGVPGAVASIFIKGGEVVVPSGTRGSAKLGADLTRPPVPSSMDARPDPVAAASPAPATPASAATPAPAPAAPAAAPASHP